MRAASVISCAIAFVPALLSGPAVAETEAWIGIAVRNLLGVHDITA
jgi:uncharacterized MnhB-related membrane protein